MLHRSGHTSGLSLNAPYHNITQTAAPNRKIHEASITFYIYIYLSLSGVHHFWVRFLRM